MHLANLPIDVVLLGLAAVFLAIRLRGILGKRTGYMEAAPPPRPSVGPGRGPVIEGRAVEVPAKPKFEPPAPETDLGRRLQSIRAIDRGFDPARFQTGAEQAFRVILHAFAAGDRDTLRPLLTPGTYAAFDAAIAAREAAGETHRTEIRQITELAITDVAPPDPTAPGDAAITVRFVSDQVNVTLDAARQPVSGVDSLVEIVDLWTFERDPKGREANWRLSETRSG